MLKFVYDDKACLLLERAFRLVDGGWRVPSDLREHRPTPGDVLF
jgi:hypothetical protein